MARPAAKPASYTSPVVMVTLTILKPAEIRGPWKPRPCETPVGNWLRVASTTTACDRAGLMPTCPKGPPAVPATRSSLRSKSAWMFPKSEPLVMTTLVSSPSYAAMVRPGRYEPLVMATEAMPPL